MLRMAVLMVLLLVAPATAQVVTLRSGEHPGFSRLVLTFPAPMPWVLGRTADGYGLQTAGAPPRYDLSTVFDRIPRDRLSAIWVDPQTGVLRLGLGCECYLRSEPFRSNILVIDIVAGAPPSDAAHEHPLENAGAMLPGLAATGPVRPRLRPRDFLPAPAVAPAPIRPPTPPPPALPDGRALALERDLLVSLRDAMAAGVIEPSAAGRRRVADAPPQQGPRLLPVVPAEPDPPRQVRLIDPDAPKVPSRAGVACVAADRLSLSTWADRAPAAMQIADLRRDLLGEFDRLRPDRLFALVRLYLHFGLGAEARGLLALAPEDAGDHALFTALADLVDGEGTTGFFGGMAGCDGPAALWSVIAEPAPGPLQDIDRAAVLRAFSALPAGLRRHLGPPLIGKFLKLADAATARALRDAIERVSERPAGPVALIDAEIALRDGRAAAADRSLEQLVTEGREVAPQALAALVATRAQRGGAISPDMLLDLEATLREHRASPEAAGLRRALALGLVVAGDYRRAFRDIAAGQPVIVPELWAVLTGYGSDIALVDMALAPPEGQPEQLPPALRMQIAIRLIDLGFPDAGLRWLQPLASESAALQRGRAALGNSDGRAALRHLAAVTLPEAEALRARALGLIGDPQAAAEAWGAAGDAAQAGRMRYIARDWPAVAAENPALARLLDPESPSGADPDRGPLAAGRALLDASMTTRARLSALLAPP